MLRINHKLKNNMKRFLLLFSSIALLIGCAIKPADISSKEFNGAVKEVTDSIYSASGKLGEIVIGESQESEIYKYNSDGKLESKAWCQSSEYDAFYSNYNYEYNSAGKLIKEEWDGTHVRMSSNHEYNNKGQLVKTEEYGSGGGERSFIVTNYEYNSAGQLIKTSKSDQKREGYDYMGFEVVTNYEYNSAGQLVKKVKHNNGESWTAEAHEYNSAGQLVAKFGRDIDDVKYKYNGDIQLVTGLQGCQGVYKYEYTKFDDKKNWIERITFIHGKVSEITKREIAYYE